MKKTTNYLNRNFKKKRSNDLLTPRKRSKRMSGIRSRQTRFEMEFIAALRKSTSYRFRTNATDIKGKPDIVFWKQKLCVFLDSDFWHGWQFPRWKHLLKNDFWRTKIIVNRRRDLKTTSYLRRHGWHVVRIWEHAIKSNRNFQISRITEVLKVCA